MREGGREEGGVGEREEGGRCSEGRNEQGCGLHLYIRIYQEWKGERYIERT